MCIYPVFLRIFFWSQICNSFACTPKMNNVTLSLWRQRTFSHRRRPCSALYCAGLSVSFEYTPVWPVAADAIAAVPRMSECAASGRWPQKAAVSHYWTIFEVLTTSHSSNCNGIAWHWYQSGSACTGLCTSLQHHAVYIVLSSSEQCYRGTTTFWSVTAIIEQKIAISGVFRGGTCIVPPEAKQLYRVFRRGTCTPWSSWCTAWGNSRVRCILAAGPLLRDSLISCRKSKRRTHLRITGGALHLQTYRTTAYLQRALRIASLNWLTSSVSSTDFNWHSLGHTRRDSTKTGMTRPCDVSWLNGSCMAEAVSKSAWRGNSNGRPIDGLPWTAD
jgi:hypothetical protein